MKLFGQVATKDFQNVVRAHTAIRRHAPPTLRRPTGHPPRHVLRPLATLSAGETASPFSFLVTPLATSSLPDILRAIDALADPVQRFAQRHRVARHVASGVAELHACRVAHLHITPRQFVNVGGTTPGKHAVVIQLTGLQCARSLGDFEEGYPRHKYDPFASVSGSGGGGAALTRSREALSTAERAALARALRIEAAFGAAAKGLAASAVRPRGEEPLPGAALVQGGEAPREDGALRFDPIYGAPEVFAADAATGDGADIRASLGPDLWALGLVLAEVYSEPYSPCFASAAEVREALASGDPRKWLDIHNRLWCGESSAARKMVWPLLEVEAKFRPPASSVAAQPFLRARAEVAEAAGVVEVRMHA